MNPVYQYNISQPVYFQRLAWRLLLAFSFLLVGMLTVIKVEAQPNITRAEYFFDTDPGFGNATPIDVPNGTGNVMTDAGFTSNISSLSTGIHQLFIRVQDANNQWSISNRTFFYKAPDPLPGGVPNIVRAEYFFDTEPGFGAGTAINVPNGTGNILTDASFTSNISSLSTGIHQLFIRVQDASNQWSISNRTFFYKAPDPLPGGVPNIVKAEYFFDTEPGFGAGNAINVANGTTNFLTDASFSSNISSLSIGVHQLFIRVQDANNQWSISNRTFFYKGPDAQAGGIPNIVKAEYFFDTEPGFGAGTAIDIPNGTGTVLTGASFTSNITALTTGVHQLFIRVKDANGQWSISNRTFFYKGPNAEAGGIPNIVKAEYFFDTEPGFGSGTDISITPGLQMLDGSFTSNVSSLTTGVHQLFIRVKDANARWSISNRTFFYKAPAISSGLPIRVVKAEYFIDTDPGFNQAIPFPFTASAAIANAPIQVAVTGLSNGTHKLFLRVLDENGKWSITNVSNFDVTNAPAGPYISGTGSSKLNLCEGDAIDVGYQAAGAFRGGNEFKVELSNESGVFSGLYIGTKTSTTSGTINCVIPGGLTNGSGYKIRIVSTNPTFSSEPLANNLFTGCIDNTPPSITLVSTNNLSCAGTNNGSIDISVSGGTAPYFYSWVKLGTTAYSANTEDISNLSPGDYRVAVTDAAYNASVLDVSISSPQPLLANATQTNITCNAGSVGSATLNPSGGTAPYNYLWSNNATTQIINNLSAGTYSFTITDANVCTVNGSLTITSSSTLSATAAGTNISCNGGSSGTASVIVSGGTAPVSYLWSNGATTQNINGLVAGLYSVTVTDANNCTASTSVTITQAAALIATASGTDILCAGSNTGTATVAIAGGNAPYTYAWSNGANTQSLNALAPGTYNVTVTDASSCTATSSVTLVALNNPPTAAITVTGSLSLCQGQTVLLAASAGSSWLWNNGATTQSITVSTGGDYSVTVSNAAGCSATSTAVTVTVSAAPVWYIDNDNDGYGTGASLTQCTRPLNGFTAAELTAITGDCDDNDPDINPAKQYFSFTGNVGYTLKVISDSTGSPYTLFRFEVDYFNAKNQLPIASFPRVLLDFEGNGIFTDANDRSIIMQPADANDLNTVDGKRYVATINGLPYGTNYKTRIVVSDNNNCSTNFGDFNYPDVLQQPNVSIFANEITFSKRRPDPGEAITVTALMRNESDYAAENFVVHLVNQYDPSIIYADKIVSYIAPHQTATVVWNITTPSVPAWCPMEVKIDYTNVITESNELDNSAVRPFVNGNYPVPGQIVTTASTSPSVVDNCGLRYITLTGNAIYTNTAVPLPDPSVAGATVDFTIVETGATFSGYTNSLGNYAIGFTAPATPGLYHITGTTTDYTLEGSFAATFTVVNCSQPCTSPDLGVSLSIAPQTIVQGSSVTGNITITNSGQTAVTIPTILALSQTGGSPLTNTTISIPALNPGQSYSTSIGNISFATPGNFYVYANADATQLVAECSESNVDFKSINVLPNLPDVIPAYGPAGQAYNCPNPTTGFTLYNAGGVAAGAFTAEVKVILNNVVVGTYQHAVPGIGVHQYYSFTAPHVYNINGTYSYHISADIPITGGGVVAELNENNNEADYINSFTVLLCKPDLTISTCGANVVQPADPVFPGSINLSVNISNAGNAIATGPIPVRFTYSTGEIFNTTYNGNLAPGQTASVTVTAPTPPSASTVLTITVDPANIFDELAESNNSFSDNLCYDFQPVASCGGQTFSGSRNLNQTATPWVAVAVNHLYSASILKVKFEVSGPGITGTLNLGYVNLNNALKLCQCPYIVTLPNSFVFSQVGTYTFTFTVDPDNAYTECNEANNVMVTQIVVTNVPDMRVLSQFINPSKLNPAPGENVNFNVTFENLGTSNINEQMKLSLMIDGQYHDQVTVNGLVTGDRNTVAIPLPWSSTLYGSHIVRAIIDAENVVVESNELNNEATRAIIVGTAANLYFTSFNASIATPGIGSTINLNAIIANGGDQACTSKVQFFYIDDLQDTVFIGEQDISITAQGTASVALPWIVADNSTTIIAKITNTNVQEFNYEDNLATTQLGTYAVELVTAQSSCGNANGTLTATATGGTAPYFYIWSNGNTGATLTAGPGTYTVNVTDATGQQVSAASTITQAADIIAPSTISCPGNITTTNTVVSWTVPTFTDNCAVINVVSNHNPGDIFQEGTTTVTYTAYDAAGNIGTCSFNVIVNAEDIFSVAVSGTNVLCRGNLTGTATATVSGGTAPYGYAWSNGDAMQSISNLAAGTYTVTVTDANNNVATGNYMVTQPVTALSANVSVTHVSCFSGSDGTATANVSGGTGAYTYLWSNGETTASVNNLSDGAITVVVTDANGCNVSTGNDITQPAAALSAVITGTNISCFGTSTGAASVTATGGTAPYTYLWNNNATTQSISNIAAGFYSVVITDANNCVLNKSITVTQPALALTATASGTNVACFGNATGTATANVSGGISAYSYVWSNGATTQSLINLVAGNYSVIVTDENGCTANSSITITQPVTALSANVSVTHISCFGGSDGTATANVSGGTGAYTYLWSNGETTASVNNLSAGAITVVVTDANGCNVSTGNNITQAAAALSATITGTNISCFGASTGGATVTATGGTAPYTYLWNNNATTESINNLSAGIYSVTITDANNCVLNKTITITQPLSALSATASGTNVSCFGNATGTATVIVSGGTAGYSYVWSNGATTQSLINLVAGNYSVIVTDENGCIANSSITITQPATVLSANVSVTHISCFGGSDGTATANVSGGTGAYTYLWSNGETTASVSNVSAGAITVVVTDANGCSVSLLSNITQPTQIEMGLQVVNTGCTGQTNGSITVDASGGTPAYQYSRDNITYQTSNVFNNLAAGTYTIYVKDSKGCIRSSVATVTALSNVTVSSVIIPVVCNGGSSGSIDLTVTGGSGNYTYKWTGPQGFKATTQDIINLKSGTYTVTITDAVNGCVLSLSFTVSQPAVLNISASKTDISSCTILGSINATATGGNGNYLYSLDGVNYQAAGTFSNLSANTYLVRLKDSKNCTASVSITISDNGNDTYENNNKQVDAAQIYANLPILARIAPGNNDKDWFKFTTEAVSGNVYSLSVTHTLVYNFDVYDARGRVVSASSNLNGIKSYYNLLPGTVYSVLVTGTSSLSCYQLLVATSLSITRQAPKTDDNIKVRVAEPILELNALVYPNPHQGSFTIQIQSPVEEKAVLQLFTVEGKLIESRRLVLVKGQTLVSFKNILAPALMYKLILQGKILDGQILGPR